MRQNMLKVYLKEDFLKIQCVCMHVLYISVYMQCVCAHTNRQERQAWGQRTTLRSPVSCYLVGTEDCQVNV